MRTAPAPPRTRARLRSQLALIDAMEMARMNVRELAEACGKQEYRHTISHLHAGTRNTCSAHLAARIERVLRVPHFNLFDPIVTTGHTDIPTQRTRKAAA